MISITVLRRHPIRSIYIHRRREQNLIGQLPGLGQYLRSGHAAHAARGAGLASIPVTSTQLTA
jgi:hypothetical protein